MPIVEPEVLIANPDKADCEAILREALARRLDALPDDRQVVLKLTLPEQPDFYRTLVEHDRVDRVVALSGGYSRDEGCRRLEINHGVIASFSRALIGDLRLTMSDGAFDAALEAAITQIYRASVQKA
jgi:fructose-bisphosphate aldolase class I